MKSLLSFIAILISISGISQPMDSVTLDNNLINWKKGIATMRGSQNIRYDAVWGSYLSIGSGNNSKVGTYNVVIGQNAFENNNTGNYNTALGKDVLKNNISGNDNVGAGWDVLFNNTSGSANIAMPQDAMYSNLRGSNNIALGRGSLYSHQIGNHNIGIGFNTFYYTNTGDENVAIGGYAGGFMYKGNGNVFIGSYAGEFNDAAVNKTINGSIYIGQYSGLNSAHSNSITIGKNTQSTGDNKINIGNTIYGDILSGDVSAKSFTISGRQVIIDDNYLYVKTLTGILKAIPLQDITATSRATTSSQTIAQQSFPIYSTKGQLIGFGTIKLNSTITRQ